MQKKYLLAPGPTPVPPEALLAMAMPIIHHRAPDFLPVLESAKKGLQWLYQTKNDVLILCSTGTGGMDGAVSNFLSPGDDVLVMNGGKFGERWTKICQAYGMKVEEVMVEWGYAVKPEQVEASAQEEPEDQGRVRPGERDLHRRVPRHQVDRRSRQEDRCALCGRCHLGAGGP